MNHETLMASSLEELDSYGKLLGLNLSNKKTAAAKVEVIERVRSKSVDIEIFGETFNVPIKRMRDKRVTDLLTKPLMSDDDAVSLFTLILGDNQRDKLFRLVTDDDGIVDADALGLALVNIVQNKKLKNFIGSRSMKQKGSKK